MPKKRFGQHFLRDQMIISRIIAALSPKTGDHLVEIGPGQGALTIPILHHHSLEVIELDRDLIPVLKERSRDTPRLHIYSADALTFDFAALKKDERPLRVFGNLPYNISTPLIFHLLTYAPLISDMTLMLQKEVADRLCARAGGEAYGRLSVMAQYHCDITTLFDVAPEAFYPPPKVQSSIVRLIPYQIPPYPAKDYALFASIVAQAFNMRRKTLRNSLKSFLSDDAWMQLSMASNRRPENLSVKEFVFLSNAIGAK